MIQADISNIWGAISLSDLLSVEKDIFDAHAILTDDEAENGDLLGFLRLPAERPSMELLQIEAAAQKIRSNSDALVVLGSSIQNAAVQAGICFVQGNLRNLNRSKGDPILLFAGNDLSSRSWQGLLRSLECRDFSLCVVSKSGNDAEINLALRTLWLMLERKYGKETAAQRVYTVTDSEEGALRRMTEAHGWNSFPFPKDLSSSFAVLSAGGLLPFAVAGIPVESLLSAAAKAQKVYDIRSMENPVWLYTAVRHLMQKLGKTTELLIHCEPDFIPFVSWLRQLYTACEGGSSLMPGSLCLPADLYGMKAHLDSVPSCLMETQLRFEAPEFPVSFASDYQDAAGLNCLSGKSPEDIQAALLEDLTQQHADLGLPMLSLDCGPMRTDTLGELFWFFQLSAALSSLLLERDNLSQEAEHSHQAVNPTLLHRLTGEN